MQDITRVIIDTLKFKTSYFCRRWAEEIKDTPHLKHYGTLNIEILTQLNESLFLQLARFLEQGMDRTILGEYFVKMGRNGVRRGYPLSEIVYGFRISQKIILEYMQIELVLDTNVVLYQALSAAAKVSDFFLLGCFYLNKGFQEATVEKMVETKALPKDILLTYFKDDFFFKK